MVNLSPRHNNADPLSNKGLPLQLRPADYLEVQAGYHVTITTAASIGRPFCWCSLWAAVVANEMSFLSGWQNTGTRLFSRRKLFG